MTRNTNGGRDERIVDGKGHSRAAENAMEAESTGSRGKRVTVIRGRGRQVQVERGRADRKAGGTGRGSSRTR